MSNPPPTPFSFFVPLNDHIVPKKSIVHILVFIHVFLLLELRAAAILSLRNRGKPRLISIVLRPRNKVAIVWLT